MSELVAGRELDALVAERVLGHTVVRPENPLDEWEEWDDGFYSGAPRLRPYSTHIAAAWQVVEKLTADRWHFGFGCDPDGIWHCWVGATTEKTDKSAPLAICRAALSALAALEAP